MVDQYGLNYFKFDGFGAGNNQVGPLEYAADVDALLDLIVRLRRSKPDLFINPSTGSWPSPFWLLYADSIWRQGNDTNTGGEGSARQKWITYRDGQILSGVLARSPLYPVSSLMIHGVFINHSPLTYKGSYFDPKNIRPTFDENEIAAEIRSFFATGVNLQELYIATDLMTPRTWDVLAEAARWARSNADIMPDTHHFVGDPLTGEVYGWASLVETQGYLVAPQPVRQAGHHPSRRRPGVRVACRIPAHLFAQEPLERGRRRDVDPGDGRRPTGVHVKTVRSAGVRRNSPAVTQLREDHRMAILDRFRLDGKKAMVTGAGRGIGQAMALALAEAGADVAVLDLDGTAAEATADAVRRLGRQSLPLADDVGKVETAQRMVDAVLAKFGRLDIAVNNVGVAIPIKPSTEVTPADWEWLFNINLRGTFFCAQAEARAMIPNHYGKIINMASICGHIVWPEWQSLYSISKAGVIHLTRCLGAEFIRHGIRSTRSVRASPALRSSLSR